jgi:hypothetical protein
VTKKEDGMGCDAATGILTGSCVWETKTEKRKEKEDKT